MTAQLIKRLREQRMQWIDIDGLPGKRVRIIRPTEVELAQHFVKAGEISVGVDEVRRFVVDWDGFTEADLLGASVGASDPVAFTPELWAEVVSDHIEWVRTLARKLLDAAIEHRTQAGADTKN
jgi:hypothetical protein